MPPKKKAAPKAKSAGLTTSVENLSNVTTRRPVKNKGEEPQNLMNEILAAESKNMNVTVVVEKMTDEYVTQITSLTENEETEKKTIQKKTVKAKAKTKSKQLEEEETKPKKGRKRAVSEDRTIIYSEEKVIGKSRKRPVNNDASDYSDTISPLKRGRRAASVDIMPSDNVAVSTKEELKKSRRVAKVTNFVDEVQKKGRKGAVKDDQPKITEKAVAKGKKTAKKVANEKMEEKEIPESTEVDEANVNEFSAEVSQEKPKTKKGLKKGQQKYEDGENEAVEKVLKRSNRAVTKAKQTEDKEVEKKSKRVAKSKQVVQSPNESEEINVPEVENDFDDKNEDDKTDCVLTPEKMPVKSKAKQNVDKELEIKSKRVGKPKQVIQSPNESEEMIDSEVENDFEEKIDEDETNWIQSPEKIAAKSKENQNEDKELEKKSKRVGKSKQVIKSPNESEEINDPHLVINEAIENSEDDETDLVVTPVKIEPKSKAKRGGRKEKLNEVENNVFIVEKENKLQKRRKAKGQDFEEAVEEGPSEVVEEKTGDIPSGLPDTPESGKDEVKPVIKRKTKAKTTRK